MFYLNVMDVFQTSKYLPNVLFVFSHFLSSLDGSFSERAVLCLGLIDLDCLVLIPIVVLTFFQDCFSKVPTLNWKVWRDFEWLTHSTFQGHVWFILYGFVYLFTVCDSLLMNLLWRLYKQCQCKLKQSALRWPCLGLNCCRSSLSFSPCKCSNHHHSHSNKN